MSLVISDLVDEDFVINRRSEPISALLFGMANLLGKPGQTLAPIVGTSLVSVLAGEYHAPYNHVNEQFSGSFSHLRCCYRVRYIPLDLYAM